MDADSRQIFIVSDTPPDFSEPSDTDSRASTPRGNYLLERPHRGEEGRRGFVIEFRRNADTRDFKDAKTVKKVKRREIKIPYPKFYERDRWRKEEGILSNAYFFFPSLSLSFILLNT